MALRIRLKRVGAKGQPCYRVVVMDARQPRDGRAIEELGGYRPLLVGDERFNCARDRLAYWVARGAQLSDTLRSLLNRYSNKKTSAKRRNKKEERQSPAQQQKKQ